MRDLIKIADSVGRTIEGVATAEDCLCIALSGNAMAVIRSQWVYDYSTIDDGTFHPSEFTELELLKVFSAEIVGQWKESESKDNQWDL